MNSFDQYNQLIQKTQSAKRTDTFITKLTGNCMGVNEAQVPQAHTTDGRDQHCLFLL